MHHSFDRLKRIAATLLWISLFASCATDPDDHPDPAGDSAQHHFLLQTAPYDGMPAVRTNEPDNAVDQLHYYIMTADGTPAQGIRSRWDAATSHISVEGLRTGAYTLLVLAVRGDAAADGAEIHRLERASDIWLSLPEEPTAPLSAEYFYARIPFRVDQDMHVVGPERIDLHHLTGRVDFDFAYRNPYVRTAEESRTLSLGNTRFHTTFTADSLFGGATSRELPEQDISRHTSLYLMPAVDQQAIEGEVALRSRSYDGRKHLQHYDFTTPSPTPNRRDVVETAVNHPDDDLGTAYITESGYQLVELSYILQDGESKNVYADRAQRSFSTLAPLQASVDDEGNIHLRFYSPRPLHNVRVKATIPALSDEPVDLMQLDLLPGFADVVHRLPVLDRKSIFRTASGRAISAPQLSVEQLRSAQISLEADDPYWETLQKIRVNIKVFFGLYGGNPDLPDGGPAGNWMGIRPVHCREAVAIWLNIAYMLGLDEVEKLLHDNPDELWGNFGKEDKIPAATIVTQMRSTRDLQAGLIWPGNGVAGLGGGSTWGVWQQSYIDHYTNAYQCSFIFHEFGHMLGYNHSSSLTYGPWAEKLMPTFYVEHMDSFPIDSPAYNDTANNPNLYR